MKPKTKEKIFNKFLEKTACFTGHRPNALGGYEDNNPLNYYIKRQLLIYIEHLILSKQVNIFISGGALGVDIWAAEAIIELKKKYNIKLLIAKPFPSQSSKWNFSQKQRYNEILKRSDKVITISKDPFSSEKMKKRNCFMVDNSKYLIAVYNGDSKSGTGHCVNYAKKLKKIIYFIDIP